MNKTISVLGSTGSIGAQTLDVAARLGIRVKALAAQRSIKMLEEQARRFNPAIVSVTDGEAAGELAVRLRGTDIKVLSGAAGLLDAAQTECDMVVNALSGAAGLQPALASIERGINIALANKETLVSNGEYVMEYAKKRGTEIIPVDSEHSAVFQCLRGAEGNPVRRVILTASGGPFRGWTREQMQGVTPEDALRHPNWNMGAKITVDSATMMNKGLEYIEAMRLFDLSPEQITVVVHPQSIIHSAVEFEDGAVIAQMGSADMRLAIQYALTFPERKPCPAPALDLTETGTLTFEKPDLEAFPCLRLAMETAELGDTACTVMADADEEAVARFLRGEIGFLDIYECIRAALERITGE